MPHTLPVGVYHVQALSDIIMIAPLPPFFVGPHRRNSKVPTSFIIDQRRPRLPKNKEQTRTEQGVRVPPHGVITTNSLHISNPRLLSKFHTAHEATDVISIPIINTSCAPPPRPCPISNHRRSPS